MLRGALGHSLKNTICAVRIKQCDGCLLRSHCLYARIFEFKPYEKKDGFPQVGMPHPYVLEYPSEIELFGPEKPLHFSLLLFGNFTDSLPYWIYSIQQMGEQGLGPKNHQGRRANFELARVRSGDEEIFKAEDAEISPPRKVPKLIWAESENSIDRLRVDLVTPLRTKISGQLLTELDFQKLIRICLRRIQAIQTAFEVQLEPDNAGYLMVLAKEVKLVRSSINWHEQTRYSNRQQEPQQMGGIVGFLELEGELAPFYPLLKIAEVVHLGKETSFGLGQIKLSVLESHEPEELVA